MFYANFLKNPQKIGKCICTYVATVCGLPKSFVYHQAIVLLATHILCLRLDLHLALSCVDPPYLSLI